MTGQHGIGSTPDSRQQVAIVAEGGGQRGIYTAGVLDAFQAASFNPFGLCVGVSAGAQNLLAYLLERPGYAQRAIQELTAAPDFFVPYRWVGARGMLDLDGYFHRTLTDPDHLIHYPGIDAIQKRRRLCFVATDAVTLTPVYLEPDSGSVVECLKASSAVPFLYKAGVDLDGRRLVDGGVADPLPIAWAIARGATRILIVRTLPAEESFGVWRDRLSQLSRVNVLPARMRAMLDVHERAGNHALALVNDPPPGVEIRVLAPATPLASQVVASRSTDLLADYQRGQREARAMLESLVEWRTAPHDNPSMNDSAGSLSTA